MKLKPRFPVCVIGLGYVGLPTAAMLARSFTRVAGYDLSETRRAVLRGGQAPFEEPGLNQMVASLIKSGSLEIVDEIPPADVYIIAVPTPLGERRQADLRAVFDVADKLAVRLSGEELVIIESTCPPNTTLTVKERIVATNPLLREAAENGTLGFAYCPERILPGNVLEELRTNDRIVGGLTIQAAGRAADLYRQFSSGQIYLTDALTAEVTKLAENAFRDVNIAFANELADISGELGTNVWEVIALANKHPRVNIHKPGAGVGGHCIAVDPWFLTGSSSARGGLIASARSVNNEKPLRVADEIVSLVPDGARCPSVLLLGLAYKPSVGDVRESPSVAVALQLLSVFPQLQLDFVDPYVDEMPPTLGYDSNARLFHHIPDDHYDVVAGLVAHPEFLGLSRSDLNCDFFLDVCGLSQASK